MPNTGSATQREGGAAISRTSGTYEATAVNTRQWVGIRLANVAMGAMSFWACAASLGLFREVSGSGARTLSEMGLFFTSWSYVHRDAYPPLIGYAYPPVALWVGLVLVVFGTVSVATSSGAAIVAAKAGLRTRRHLLFSRSERLSDLDAARNLTRQLHARGRAGLFSGGRLYFGIGLVGAGVVLVTSLLAPTNITTSSQTIHDVQKGLLPTVCLVGSLIVLIGLLLSFPYGPRERVVVDVLGNVRGTDEPILPPSVPQQAQSPAQGYSLAGTGERPGVGVDITASDASVATATGGPRSSSVRAKLALALVGLTSATIGLVALNLLGGIDLANRFDSLSADEIHEWQRALSMMTGLYVLAYIASAIAFLAWLSRVVDNVPALGGGKPSASRAGAIGWWFVPFVNLVKPYRIVADVWRRLATGPAETGTGLVLAWWVLWLGGVLVAQLVATAAAPAATADAWRQLLVVQTIALLGQLVAGGLLLRIIWGIERRSKVRTAAIARPTAPPPAMAPTSWVPSSPEPVTPPAFSHAPTAPAAFCLRCGTRRISDARFCGGCGAAFEVIAQS